MPTQIFVPLAVALCVIGIGIESVGRFQADENAPSPLMEAQCGFCNFSTLDIHRDAPALSDNDWSRVAAGRPLVIHLRDTNYSWEWADWGPVISSLSQGPSRLTMLQAQEYLQPGTAHDNLSNARTEEFKARSEEEPQALFATPPQEHMFAWYAWFHDHPSQDVLRHMESHGLDLVQIYSSLPVPPPHTWHIYDDGFWWYAGMITGYTASLLGTQEHIDMHQADGTMHVQVRGDKAWKLRADSGCEDVCGSRVHDFVVPEGI